MRRISKRQKYRGYREGWRSGLEKKVANELSAMGVSFTYEKVKVQFTEPSKKRTYTPDFQLPNGIIVETKGRFTAQDRRKHILVAEQNPHLDIRFVFSNSKTKIYKGSKTSYADWCDKYGFKYADKSIPVEWIEEGGI